MRNHCLLFAALLAASPSLFAQDAKKAAPAAPAQMPDPKAKQHDALKMYVGDWTTTAKMAPMPGVPGMEKAQESTGPEHAELICNGLFVKSTVTAAWSGKPFQGIWIGGYDPFAQKYTSLWVDSEGGGTETGQGTYDEKAKTWTFVCQSAMGPTRSTSVWKDNDTWVTTSWMKGGDGKETQMMEITRHRAKGASAAPGDAAAQKPAPLSPEMAVLAQGNGNWDATVTIPGMPDSKATAQVMSTCCGTWQWSNFQGTMMGTPFEGHALSGWDVATKKYNNYWLDTMSPVVRLTTGAGDAAKKVFTFEGNCVDGNGEPMTAHEVMTITDVNSHTCAKTFKTAARTGSVSIAYKRAAK